MFLLVLLRTDPHVSHQWHSGKPMRRWQHNFRHGHSERGAVGTVWEATLHAHWSAKKRTRQSHNAIDANKILTRGHFCDTRRQAKRHAEPRTQNNERMAKPCIALCCYLVLNAHRLDLEGLLWWCQQVRFCSPEAMGCENAALLCVATDCATSIIIWIELGIIPDAGAQKRMYANKRLWNPGCCCYCMNNERIRNAYMHKPLQQEKVSIIS